MKSFARFPLVCSAILLLSSVPVLANPVSDGSIHTHVHSYEYPTPPPITHCSQIVQHTAEEGWVDFDFYAYERYGSPGFGVDACQITFSWPGDWYYDVYWYEFPNGGTGTIDVNGNQATAYITYPGCPTTDGELFLLLRCSFAVEGYGAIEPLEYGNWVNVCSGGSFVDIPSFGGEAGVDCEFDYVDCDLHHRCHPVAETPLLVLEADPGESLSELLQFEVCGSSSNPCAPFFVGTEAWMSVDVGEPDDCQYPITLDIDTGNLPPGEYTGWVKAEDQGAGCTRIVLTVLDLTGIERQSWSRIKTNF